MILMNHRQLGWMMRWLLAVGLILVAGCGRESLDGTYGRRRGSPGATSVNGTAVLSEMFRQAGSTVVSRRFLSPRIYNHDVIVWAPDDFQPPDDETRRFLEDWLFREPGRTLVYIGRDYDAEIAYWEAVLDMATADQRVEVLRRLAQARAAHSTRRATMPQGERNPWFMVWRDADSDPDDASAWTGTWTQDDRLQVSKLSPEIVGRLEPPPSDVADADDGNEYRSEVLLQGPPGILAYRLIPARQPDSQILVMTNGSFLLNFALMEEEHRRLAARLIVDCGAPAKVVFFESGPDGGFVFQQEPGSRHPTGLEAFTVWPLGGILWHFLVLGVLYLFARLAIFGRPQQLPPDSTSDFGRHVHALGELLAATGQEDQARRQLAQFHDRVKHEPRTGPPAGLDS
jgi:hypothetical protein